MEEHIAQPEDKENKKPRVREGTATFKRERTHLKEIASLSSLIEGKSQLIDISGKRV